MRTDRRAFLGTAAAAVAAAAPVFGGDERRPLRLGLIGAGWYGMVDARAALKAGGVEIVAVCDVDQEHLAKAADELEKKQSRRPQTFKLYQDLLAVKGLDGVILATPPHWHALPFLAALEAGLHIYCEKPLAYDIREGQAMVEAARRRPNQIVQIGFQRRQAKAFQQAREFIAAGKAGNIVQVDAQIHYRAGTKDPTPQDPPATLDWDLWCGPGPKIPYSPQVGHMNWRLEKTSGHGHLVDWGIHIIDAARVILGESMPKRVVAAGGIYQLAGKITTPDTLTAHFEFARCPLVWRHRIWGAEEYTPEVSNGLLFYGDKATVFATDSRWVVIPQGKSADRQETKTEGNAGEAHMADFLAAVRAGKPAACTIDDAFRSTVTVQLAMIAHETGTAVEWDAEKLAIVGNTPAEKLLKREYRAPYKHPYAG